MVRKSQQTHECFSAWWKILGMRFFIWEESKQKELATKKHYFAHLGTATSKLTLCVSGGWALTYEAWPSTTWRKLHSTANPKATSQRVIIGVRFIACWAAGAVGDLACWPKLAHWFQKTFPHPLSYIRKHSYTKRDSLPRISFMASFSHMDFNS